MQEKSGQQTVSVFLLPESLRTWDSSLQALFTISHRQEDSEEIAGAALTGVASEAEAVTAGASEGAAEATGGATVLERWMPGQTRLH